MSKQTSPAANFYKELKALRKKYPMVYIEAWTPEDFVVYEEDIDDVPPVDWNHPFHIITADNLRRHFDAEIGTNWDRVRYESVSVK